MNHTIMDLINQQIFNASRHRFGDDGLRHRSFARFWIHFCSARNDVLWFDIIPYKHFLLHSIKNTVFTGFQTIYQLMD